MKVLTMTNFNVGRPLFFLILTLIFVNQRSYSQSTSRLFIEVSKVNPKYLAYTDGSAFIPVGLNICWPRFENQEYEILAKMKKYFVLLSQNGGNYTRVWLSAPQFQVENEKEGVYNESIAKRVDFILVLAREHNIKVKFCLEHFRKLTDSPAAFKGSVPFDRPVYHSSNGGPVETMEDFFLTQAGREAYLNRLKFFSDRYKNDPIIFGWELWNEINAVPIEDEKILQRWTSDMLVKAKELFPNHLVMQSLGSFDSEKSRSIYNSYSTLEKNAIAQIHRYLDPGAPLAICQAPMDILASDAVHELLNFDLSKPVIVSEIGAVEAKHAGPSKLYESDSSGMLLHDLLFAPFFAGAAAPGQSWHWNEYIEKKNLWYHFQRFSNAVKDIDPVKENFVSSITEQNGIRIYTLKGNHTTLLWCRGIANTWQSELVKKLPPSRMKNKKIKLDAMNEPSCSIYDPWNDVYKKATIRNAKIKLPEFKRSLVVRIDKLN